MKKTITFAALALLFIYAGCQAQGNKKAEEAAVSAAKEWLAMVDDGKFGENDKNFSVVSHFVLFFAKKMTSF